MKTLNLVIQFSREWDKYDTFVVPYAIRDDVEDPEAALRAAVQDFLASGTEDAKHAIDYSCGYFNWGDVLSFVPNSYFVNRGLTPIEGDFIDVTVNHDEVLEKSSDKDEDDDKNKEKIQ